jgi:uncharacterized membrane protein
VRLAPLLSLALASAAVESASACGGGSPASPTFSPTNAVASADDPDSSLDDSVMADGSVGAIMTTFARCTASPAAGSFPADVADVLMNRCQPCHTDPPLNGAPFPLLAYGDVHKVLTGTAMPIYEEMYLLIQPGADPHMPYGNAPQLSPDQFNTLSSWLLSCAPPGE